MTSRQVITEIREVIGGIYFTDNAINELFK